ncbi:hypothetical protein Sjap_008431 [Stephania japonica]|uniref:Uncharacterized protein n=1 Tax=Stephania japonica TaxID=461633 RepID=A0AAP0JRW1_9MAGN
MLALRLRSSALFHSALVHSFFWPSSPSPTPIFSWWEFCDSNSLAYLHHLSMAYMALQSKELGRDCTPLKLYLHVHTKKHDGQTFIDARSERVNSMRDGHPGASSPPPPPPRPSHQGTLTPPTAEHMEEQRWKPIVKWSTHILAIHLANARVMVLAATNQPLELDEAILRRIPQAFEIGMPDQ